MRSIEERNKLAEKHLRLVSYFGDRYRGLVEWDDIVGAGSEGLLVAAERWDESRGVAFSSYAQHWIRQRILLLIRNKDLVRVPHTAAASKNPDDKRAPYVAAATRAPLSMDYMMTPNGTLAEVLPDESAEDVGDPFPRELAEVMVASPRLAPSEREVLTLVLGLDGPPLHFAAVGRRMNKSRERVRQLYQRAVEKLRHDPAIVREANALGIKTTGAPPPITNALYDARTSEAWNEAL